MTEPPTRRVGGGGLRVVVVNQYFPPDTSATARICAELVEALVAAGHDVTVVAGRPSYDPTDRHPWRPWRAGTWPTPAGAARVVRVGSTAFDRRRGPGRVANYLSYLAGAVPATLAARADVWVVMTDPPVPVLALWGRRRPVLYNVRDLHPDFAVATGLAADGPLVRAWDRLQRAALARATTVVALGDDMAERLVAKGADPARVRVVRDGAPPAGPPPAPGDPTVARLRGPWRFTLVHAGNIGFAGAWDTLLEAAKLLADDGVGLVFVGDGAAAADLRRRAPDNVAFHPFQPPERIPAVMAAGDLQVVTVRPGVEGLVVPSKLYGILAHGRPVLAVAPERSDVARIVTATGAGVVADPEDPAAVAEAVRGVIGDPLRLCAMAAGASTAAKEFQVDKAITELTHIISSFTIR